MKRYTHKLEFRPVIEGMPWVEVGDMVDAVHAYVLGKVAAQFPCGFPENLPVRVDLNLEFRTVRLPAVEKKPRRPKAPKKP